ncbi:PAS domain S-box protein [Hymenobacter sp. YC55]|uniref:PAS domain S-box protein n=1 Tax=Hymenobacter sp. YC55 TaxID=3034019 RepID=UPI0023F61EF7|nr:PAS domain S-box protein [Hymenobacter sp. YC55]MDF7815617.1 PAS domain S-box protein [Hymenobacter sp. YC55]
MPGFFNHLPITSSTTPTEPPAGGDKSLSFDEHRAGLKTTSAGSVANILVVVDNADTRSYVQRILAQQPQWIVQTATDGLQALEGIAQQLPDLILSDVMLARLDSFGLLQALKQDARTARIPVVLLLPRADDHATIEEPDWNADEYLVEPFAARELLARVRTQLELTRARQENAKLRAAEQQLVASEQHYRLLIEEALVATALFLGPEIRIQYANATMLAFWGKDASVHGKTIREALPELEGQPFPALLEQVYATGEAYVGVREPATLLVEGHLKTSYFNFTYKPLRNEAGEVYGIHHTAIDVTEEVQSQQQIEEEKERAQLAIEVGGLGVFESDLATQELVADQRFNEILGFDGPQTRNSYLSVFHPDDAANRAQAIEQGLQTGSFEYEARFIHVVTKQVRWVKIRARIYRNALGKPAAVLGVAQDTTEQRTYTAALHESEQRFRILADAAPNQVWAVNPDSTIRYINRAFLDFVGVEQEQYLVTGWGPYMHPEELESAQQTLTQAISARAPYRLEHRMRRHDGQYRWLLAQGAPSYYPNGELYGYVGSAIDITELKETNQQLVRTNTDLDNFIYTASHDLKAPITNIEGLLSTLAEELPTEQRNEEVTFILGLMQGAVERFKRTIEHLTDISKLQQEHTLVTTEVNLAEIVEDVRLDLAPLLQDTGTKLDVKVGGCPNVRFSAKNLRSVVYNLLSNAIKYHSPARVPQVQIHCLVTAEHHILTVTDNGQGIEARQLGQLFTMFQRFHTHVEGSGVGLYMVKKMVENAGGRIEVQSQVNVGSTFTVYFPR